MGPIWAQMDPSKGPNMHLNMGPNMSPSMSNSGTPQAMNSADRTYCARARAGVAVALLSLLAGCSHMPNPHLSWPWHHKQAAPPQEVHELTIEPGAEGAASGATPTLPQYWQRNTLLIDLQSAGGTGSIVLKPVPGTTWPARLAFRVMPGQFGILEVRGAQRMLLPITTQGAKPVDLELLPGVYTARTPQITVTWEAASAPAQSPSGDR